MKSRRLLSSSSRDNVSSLRSHFEDMTNIELVLACQEQNQMAFDVLIRRNQPLITSLLFRYAPEMNNRSDMMQEVVIRIWTSIRTLRNPHAFHTWLKRIVQNIFYDHLRQRPADAVLSLDQTIDQESGSGRSLIDEVVDVAAKPDELSLRRELMHAINEAVNELPSDFREALVLREFDGKDYKEIATMTRSELGTVKSRIARARARVQAKLQDGYLAS